MHRALHNGYILFLRVKTDSLVALGLKTFSLGICDISRTHDRHETTIYKNICFINIKSSNQFKLYVHICISLSIFFGSKDDNMKRFHGTTIVKHCRSRIYYFIIVLLNESILFQKKLLSLLEFCSNMFRFSSFALTTIQTFALKKTTINKIEIQILRRCRI